MVGVMEYLAAKILEIAGNAVRDNKKSCIIPRHLQLAIKNDEELNKLLARLVTIAEGAVLPNIQVQPEPLPAVPLFGTLPARISFRRNEVPVEDIPGPYGGNDTLAIWNTNIITVWLVLGIKVEVSECYELVSGNRSDPVSGPKVDHGSRACMGQPRHPLGLSGGVKEVGEGGGGERDGHVGSHEGGEGGL